MRSYLPVLSLLLALHSRAHALTFDIRVRSGSNSLTRRGPNTIPVANTHNAEYIANVTLGGRDIPVLLDTGSSDLWVTGTVPNSQDTGKSVSLSYAVGQASGDIWTADMSFAGYNVSDQAYLLVEDTSQFSLDIVAQGFYGLIGLGPATGSVIRDKYDKTKGDSVLGRIFSQNTTASNFLTILLNRLDDPMSPPTGQMTISETLPEYGNITSMPKLPVDKVHRLTDEDQHWQVFGDVNGIIGPDGNPIQYKSIVPGAPKGQAVVVFDSGFTLSQVPRDIADAIYGRVQGAEYNTVSEVWTIPCDQYLSLTFKFGGIDYPIHPLDISSSEFNMVNSLGDTVCLGAFQPITSAFSLLGEYDMILGMSFMRNVYTLLDYGNFIDHSSNDQGDPFVQLVSVTNAASAKEDFIKIRLNGVDTTGSAAKALLPPDKEQHSPISDEEKKKQYEELVLSRWPEIFVGCLAFVLIVAGLIIWRCCVHRRKKRAERSAAMVLPDTNSISGRSQAGSQVALNRMDTDDMGMRQSYQREYRPSFASSRHQV